MCGLVGYLVWGEGRTALPLEAAVGALAHRGPDGRGVLEASAGRTRCGLAHTRLAIIDLSESGRQPMLSHGGRYAIAYNGEVFNFGEIRAELEREGVALRSSSDTEVVVEAFARWGPACLARMRGMFAFAVWDTKLGELFLARDRLGIKPLYVARGPDRIVFASEVRALLALGVVPRRASTTGLASYLSWGSVADPLTIIDGVASVPPGHYLTVREGREELRKYWSPAIARTSPMSFDEAVARVRPVLTEAVNLRLVSDVPVGVFLSGGIDSSVITAIAAAASVRPLHTFTVAFEEQEMTEERHAAEVARSFGCEHRTIMLRPDAARADLPGALAALDQPSADGINTYFVARAVRAAGIKVALSGLGGDEVFAGYHYFRQFGVASKMAGLLPVGTSALAARLMETPLFSRLPPSSKKAAQLLGTSPTPGGVYSALRCMFTPRIVSRLLPGADPQAGHVGTLPPQVAAAWEAGAVDPVNVLTVLELSNYLRNTLLRDADVMSMAHGLEVRVPLLDHKLIEAMLEIPGSLKLGKEVNKPLLVSSAPLSVGAAGTRSKMGFTLPFERWLRGSLMPMVSDLLAHESLRALGIDMDVVASMWSDFLRNDRRVNYSRIWCLAALSAWAQQNEVSA